MHKSRLSTFLRGMLAVAGLLAVTCTPARAADEIVLAVQPILSEDATREAFQPLADFITQVTGRKCVLQTRPNFLSYWSDTYKGSYSLVFDAAHFTDYRIKKLGFQVLAKIPDGVSFSLVANSSSAIIDPSELIGKTVATLGPPSIGAARLAEFYPNPTRQPIVVEVESSEKGFEMLQKGEVVAAMLPTPLVAQEMSSGATIDVVAQTKQIPHIAVSASPQLDETTRNKIRNALLNADKTPAGQAMLKAINFPRFVAATPDIYAGQSEILSNTYGY